MKIEQKTEQKFEPITLTIETKQELLVILGLLGGLSNFDAQVLTGESIKNDFIYNAHKNLYAVARSIGISERSHRVSCEVKEAYRR